jgi:hypothetical protein
VGRAFVRVWPLSRVSLLGVPDTFDGIATAGEGRRGAGG